MAWPEGKLIEVFGALRPLLEAYDDLTEAPNQPALFHLMLPHLAVDLLPVDWEQSWMGATGARLWFSTERDAAWKQLSDLLLLLDGDLRRLEREAGPGRGRRPRTRAELDQVSDSGSASTAMEPTTPDRGTASSPQAPVVPESRHDAAGHAVDAATLRRLLDELFPGRHRSVAGPDSALLGRLNGAGLSTVEALRRAAEEGRELFLAFERRVPPEPFVRADPPPGVPHEAEPQYYDVAALRNTLLLSSPAFRRACQREGEDVFEFEQFANWFRSLG